MKIIRFTPQRVLSSVLALAGASVLATASAADRASGSIAFGKHAATIAHATLVRGPDEMDPSRTILRLYLSSGDIGAKIKTCKTLSCADLALGDGASVDFGDAPHLGYAVELNGGLAQYSGGTDRDAFKLTTNRPDRLAGKLHIDDAAAGGAKIDADFDAALANTFKSVR
jgi:hypothetical protein